mgnify:CR=1 FL=1
MAEKVLHVIIKILMYIFIVLLFILLFVRMSGVGRAIFADKPKDKNPQIASETVLVVEQGESLLEIYNLNHVQSQPMCIAELS